MARNGAQLTPKVIVTNSKSRMCPALLRKKMRQFFDWRQPWIVYINGNKQVLKGRPPHVVSGENLGFARRQPTARGNVGLGSNSLNLGSLGYHIRDLSPTSPVHGIAVAVFSFENWQTISCIVSGFCYAPGAFVVLCFDAGP